MNWTKIMAWQDKDNHELDELLTSSHIQDTWKSKEAQSKKKSIKFVILRDVLIILGSFGFIMFLVWNIWMTLLREDTSLKLKMLMI